MKVLFIGDIFGKCGRKAISEQLKQVVNKYHVDFTIANAENCTHGRSININHFNQLKNAGINFFTFGNHTYENDEIVDILSTQKNTVRPLNLKPKFTYFNLGLGSRVINVNNKKIRITNLLGNSINFHEMQTNPFIELNYIIDNDTSDIHIIDFHAETTSEKNAFLLNFAGRVSAIIGTHTHVQTADNRIYKNTAYITDVGMTGANVSIIGADPEDILKVFRQENERFRMKPANSKYQFNAVIIDFDDLSNKPISIDRIYIVEQ